MSEYIHGENILNKLKSEQNPTNKKYLNIDQPQFRKEIGNQNIFPQ